jgi:transposase
MRVGQKNKRIYVWAKTGTRPRLVHDQRTQSLYLFGATCPGRGEGAALALPECNTEAMQLHLNEISLHVAPGAHAILLCDRAGWHTTGMLRVPANITIIFIPPRSPELNPQENMWQFIRQNWLSNRVFKTYDDILALTCEAWNKLTAQPWRIMSIGLREWATISQPS